MEEINYEIDNIYLFKVEDYTTILLGKLIDDKYIIQRGDGKVYSYDKYRVTWAQKLEFKKIDTQEGIREPICLTVKYNLAFEFRALVEKTEGCVVKNVIEIKSGELLQYWIDCPKEKENLITDMAFMTWIKNPVFQKYYHGTKAFDEISEKYISEHCK